MRGVKENLKPDAYKQSELGSQNPEARNRKGIPSGLLTSGLWFLGDGVPLV